MDLKQLRERGAFVAPPVPTEVTWKHRDESTGEVHTDTFTVHVRRMSVGAIDRIRAAAANSSERSWMALTISEGVLFGEGGAEKMSYDEAYQLNFGLGRALLRAFNDVNETEELDNPKL